MSNISRLCLSSEPPLHERLFTTAASQHFWQSKLCLRRIPYTTCRTVWAYYYYHRCLICMIQRTQQSTKTCPRRTPRTCSDWSSGWTTGWSHWCRLRTLLQTPRRTPRTLGATGVPVGVDARTTGGDATDRCTLGQSSSSGCLWYGLQLPIHYQALFGRTKHTVAMVGTDRLQLHRRMVSYVWWK